MKYLFTFVILCSFKSLAYSQPPTETVGNPTDSALVSMYKGWTNQGVLTFSGTAQVQNIQPSNYQSASRGGNVFFTNTSGTYLEISGFPSDSIDRFEMAFGIYNSDTANSNSFLIEYSKDGINYFPFPDSNSSNYPASAWTRKFVSLDSHLNPKDLRLRFTQTSATTQIRIDDIDFGYAILLSIKLQQFTSLLNENSVLLSWTASSSSSREIFSVEKSSNGTNFTTLQEQSAKGSGTYNYSFTDPSPLSASTYYKLKMRSEDGSDSYSKILHVQPKPAQNNILQSIYPLPAKDRLNIQIQSSKTEKAEISVADVSGKTLITNYVLLAEGANNAVINIQLLDKGVYFLKVVTSQATETRKIVIGQ